MGRFLKGIALIFLTSGVFIGHPSAAGVGEKYSAVHIFSDIATTPSLLQMTAYLKAPSEDLKVVLWRRFQGYDKGLKENTIEVICPDSEYGMYLCGQALKKKIAQIYKSLPNAEYIIHGNDKHFYVIGGSLLSVIPKKQIRMIHLYEDGNATKWRTRRNNNGNMVPIKKLKNVISHDEAPPYFPYDLVLGRLYPTTMHYFFADRMRQDAHYAPYIKTLSTSVLENVDYAQIAQTLSEQDKHRLFKMAGFNYRQLKELFQKKKNIVITLPILGRNSDDFFAITRAIGFLMIDGYGVINPKEYTFFYKPHPALFNYEYNPVLKKLFPETVFLPRRLPYELLILGGFKIDYVFGTHSSLYYTLSPNQILKWFPASYYTSSFKTLDLADESKRLNPDDFKDKP